MCQRVCMGDSPPMRKRAYRDTPANQEQISRQTREMLDAGIIEEKGHNVVQPGPPRNQNGRVQVLVVEYMGLNAVTALTSWPLPTKEEVLDSISEQRPVYRSTLDLLNGYWQTELDSETADRRDSKLCLPKGPVRIMWSRKCLED